MQKWDAPKVVRLLKDFLESLLQSSQNKYIWKEAAKALIIIDPDHSEAIRLLIGELYTSLQTRRALIEKEIAEILEETPEETEQLSDIPLPPTIEHWKGNEFDDILQRVTPGNREASSSLVELIKTCENQGARYIAASLLGKIGTDSSDVVDTLIRLQSNTEYPDARILAANSLWKIQPNNSHTIETLVELIQCSQDRRIQAWAVRSMKDIGTDNPDVVIDVLIDLLHPSKSFCNKVIDVLGEVGTGKQKVIAALKELWEVSKNWETRNTAADNLVKIGVDNPEITDNLVRILLTNRTSFAMWKLKKKLSSRLLPLNLSKNLNVY